MEGWTPEPRNRGGVTGVSPKHCIRENESMWDYLLCRQAPTPDGYYSNHLWLFPLRLALERSWAGASQSRRGGKTREASRPSPLELSKPRLDPRWGMREYLRSLGFSIISDYTRNTPNAFVLKVIKGRDGWTQASLVLEFVHLGMLFKKIKI